MDIYLVGGAVRDALLGLPVVEKDWVVVGATPDQLLNQNYQQVGKDFPVFLHPKTKEEYALARTERKTSSGHTGFICDASEFVTLEEDLRRRDLTINAIAQNQSGTLIDPYNGQKDLKERVLRHVSPAFREDPLRVLRLARFYAKFTAFKVAPETLDLVSQMVAEDQLAELPSERVWMELYKTLSTSSPHRFFELLNTVGAASKLWPELSENNIKQLRQAQQTTDNTDHRLTLTLMDLPLDDLKSLLDRLKLPNYLSSLVVVAAKNAPTLLVDKITSHDAVEVFYQTDAFRKPERFKNLLELTAIKATINQLSPKIDWQVLFDQISPIGIQDIEPAIKGPAISEAIRAKRETEAARLLNQD